MRVIKPRKSTVFRKPFSHKRAYFCHKFPGSFLIESPAGLLTFPLLRRYIIVLRKTSIQSWMNPAKASADGQHCPAPMKPSGYRNPLADIISDYLIHLVLHTIKSPLPASPPRSAHNRSTILR